MAKSQSTKNTPSWRDVKSRLVRWERTDLIDLLRDMYAASHDNKAFLQTRLSLGNDLLLPYKEIISCWVNPSDPRRPVSISHAKKAIADYKKALGKPEGMAELSVFYCEEVFNFLDECGVQDPGYFDALAHMFAQALNYVLVLPDTEQLPFLDRLNRLRLLGEVTGMGVGDDLADLWSQAGIADYFF